MIIMDTNASTARVTIMNGSAFTENSNSFSMLTELMYEEIGQ